MSRLILLAALCLFPQLSSAATFGTVTTVVGSVSDIVLDEELDAAREFGDLEDL